MNRTFKTNAAKGVNNHYNEYKEFHAREGEAHVCASFMEMSGMTTLILMVNINTVKPPLKLHLTKMAPFLHDWVRTINLG